MELAQPLSLPLSFPLSFTHTHTLSLSTPSPAPSPSHCQGRRAYPLSLYPPSLSAVSFSLLTPYPLPSLNNES